MDDKHKTTDQLYSNMAKTWGYRKEKKSSICFIPSSLPDLGSYRIPGAWGGLVPMTGLGGSNTRKSAPNLNPYDACVLWFPLAGS